MTKKRLNKFINNLSLWILICIKALLCICSFLFLSRCLFYDPVRIFDNPEYLIIFTTWGFQFFWASKFIRSIALYINSNLKRYPSVLKTDLKILCTSLKYRSSNSLKLSKDNNIILIILCILCFFIDMVFIYIAGTLGYIDKLLPYFTVIIWLGTTIFTTYCFIVYLILFYRRIKIINRFLSQMNRDE